MTPDPRTGSTISPEQRLRNVVEEIQLADHEVAPVVKRETAGSESVPLATADR